MITLNKLLQLQFLYCILGITFNLISYFLIATGEKGLTSTIPLQGILVMSIYGFFLLTGWGRKIVWYRFLMLVSVLVFGYGGILKHLFYLNQYPELYYSVFAGILGVIINVFGFSLNLMAVFKKFK